MGPTEANTAIGFIRPVLDMIKSKLPEAAKDVIDVPKAQRLIDGSMITAGQDSERNRTWNLLLADLSAEFGEFGATVPRVDAVDLIDMYYRNADIDPPRLANDEYAHVVEVWTMLQTPKSVLEGLSLFMARPLKYSIAG